MNDLHALLTDVAEFLEGQQDVVDGCYGIVKPNTAMQLLSRVQEELRSLERELARMAPSDREVGLEAAASIDRERAQEINRS